MKEGQEQKNSSEEEAKRRTRDAELIKMLATNQEERMKIIRQCLNEEIEKGDFMNNSHGDMTLVAFYCGDPSNFEIGQGEGSHVKAVNDVFGKIPEQCRPVDAIEAHQFKGESIWRGTVHCLPGFKSRVVRVFFDIKNKYDQERRYKMPGSDQEENFIDLVGRAWEFFKEKFPDWIMIDTNGNPLEEVLKKIGKKD